MRKFIRLSAGILVLMLSLPAFAHTPGWSGCTRTCVQSNPNLDPHDPHCPSEPAPLACQGGGSVVVAPTLTGCQITGNVGLCSSYGQPTLAPTPPTSSSNGSIPATPVPESEGYTNTNVDNQKEKLVQDNLNYQLTLDGSIGQIIKTITELEDQNSAIHFQHILELAPGCKTGAPVQLNNGCKITSKDDFTAKSNTLTVELQRTHSSKYRSDWTLGPGWGFSLDSRIIWGTKDMSGYHDTIAEYQENQLAYEKALKHLKDSIVDLEEMFQCDDGSAIPDYKDYFYSASNRSYGNTVYSNDESDGACNDDPIYGSKECTFSTVTPIATATAAPTTTTTNSPSGVVYDACYITIQNTTSYLYRSHISQALANAIGDPLNPAENTINWYINSLKTRFEVEIENGVETTLLEREIAKLELEIEKANLQEDKNLFTVDQNFKAEAQIGLKLVKWITPQGNRILFELDESTGNYLPIREHNNEFKINTDGTYQIKSTGNVRFNYNEFGLLESIQDRFGHGYLINRDATTQKIESVIDSFNRTFIFDYYGHGKLKSILDPQGRKLTFEYHGVLNLKGSLFYPIVENDESGTSLPSDCELVVGGSYCEILASVTPTPSYQEIEKECDVEGQPNCQYYLLSKVSSFDGTVEEYRYNDLRDSLVITNKIRGDISGDGVKEEFEYTYKEQDGRLVVDRQYDPLDYFWEYEYDFSTDDPLGKNTTVYDRRLGGATTDVDYLKYYYDEFNRTVERQHSWKDAYVSFVYDENGNLEYQYNELLEPTQYGYDDRGQMTSVIDAAGIELSYEKGPWGEVNSRTDAKGTTTFVRDSDTGEIDKIIFPDQKEIDETWENGLIKQRIDQDGFVTVWDYDDYGYVRSKQVFASIDDINSNDFELYEIYVHDSIGRLKEFRVFKGLGPRGGHEFNVTRYTYRDELGRELMKPVTITDAIGRTASYKYDAQLNVKEFTDFSGVRTVFTYTKRGNVETKKVYMPTPYVVGEETLYEYSYTYDAEGNLKTATHPGEVVWEYDYNGDNQLIEAFIQGTNTKVTYHYDLAGRKLWEQQEGDLGRKDWSYYPNGQLQTYSNELGATIVNYYDTRGDLDRVYNQQVGATTHDYERDDLGRVYAWTDGENNRFEYKLNDRGLVEDYLVPNSTETMINRQLNYRGQPLIVNDIEGGTQSNKYDNRGNLVEHTNAYGGVTSYKYDGINRLIYVLTPANLRTDVRYEYDASQTYLVVTTTHTDLNLEEGHEDRIRKSVEHYDLLGRLIYSQDALEQQWSYLYNERGLLERVTNPDLSYVEYLYTTKGDVEFETVYSADGESRRTQYVRDELGRVEKTIYPHDLEISFEYNDLDQVTDIYRNDIWYQNNFYDSLGRLKQRTTADAKFEKYDYDRNSNLNYFADQAGYTWNYDNNAFGQPETVTDPYSNPITYGFDRLGRKLSTTDQLAHTQRVSLNGAGQVQYSFDAYDIDNSEPNYEYVYDTSGRLTDVYDEDRNRTQFAYNAFGELTSETNALEQTTVFGYDLLGRRDSLDLPASEPQSWQYNFRNQSTVYTDGLGKTFTQAYDGFGNLDYVEQVSDLNYGVYQSNAVLRTDYLFDAGNRLREVKNANGHTRYYNYDQFDRLEEFVDETNKKTTYKYDLRDRVDTVSDNNGNAYIAYRYDHRDLMTSRSYRDHEGNWLNDSYEFNKLGYMTHFESANGYSETFTYDDAMRLDYVTNHTLGQTLDYTFDDNNRQTFLSDSFGGTGTTYLRDDEGYITEIHHNGEITKLHRDELGRVFARELPNNTRDIAVFDANGRTVATLTQVKAGNRDTDSVIAYMGYQPNQLHRINDKRIDHLSEYVSTQAHSKRPTNPTCFLIIFAVIFSPLLF